jgi:hypothetical protein
VAANDDYLSAVEARIRAVLLEGRGVDGSLGPDAQARAIAAGTFRAAAENASLADPSYPGEQFDRAISTRYASVVDDVTNNPYSSPQWERVTLVVTVGYQYGAASTAFIDPQGNETAAVQKYRADRRGIGDSRRIKQALEFNDLRGLDTDPVMVNCTRVGGAGTDLGGGRYIMVNTFALVLQSVVTDPYGP